MTDVPSEAGADDAPATQTQQMVDLLRSSPVDLTDLEIGLKLGIPYGIGTRLVQLHLQGLVEPIKHKGRRQTWRAVPEDRRELTKQVAAKRAQKGLLRSFQSRPPWQQLWLAEQMFRPGDGDGELVAGSQIKVPCPEVEGTGACTCPNLNVTVLRHTKGTTPAKSRVRAETARWQRDRQRLLKDIEEAQAAGSPIVDYYQVKLNLAEGRHMVRAATAFLSDHQDKLLMAGAEHPEVWDDFTGFVTDAEEDVAALRATFDRLAHDRGDWIDVEEEVIEPEWAGVLMPGADLPVIEIEAEDDDDD